MAEQPTADEKVDQVYRQQFDMQRQTLHMMAEQHQQELKRQHDSYMEQRERLQDDLEERRREFDRQNDGMLGAIGRLHTENEALRKKLADSDEKVKMTIMQAEVMRRELDAKLVEHQAEHDRHVSDIKADAERRIKELEKQLSAAKAKSRMK